MTEDNYSAVEKALSWSELTSQECSSSSGPSLGLWCPRRGCDGLSVLLVPYRGRAEHLRLLLSNVFRWARARRRALLLLVVEQGGEETFNRGALLNAAMAIAEGLARAMGLRDLCLLSHDVDLVPRDGGVSYSCGRGGARHVGSAQRRFGHRLPYASYAGGVLGLSADVARRVDGYSNAFWGWGGEDDDLARRLARAAVALERLSANESAFLGPAHQRDFRNLPKDSAKSRLQRAQGRRDGLSTLRFRILPSSLSPLAQNIDLNSTCLFRHFLVQLDIDRHK